MVEAKVIANELLEKNRVQLPFCNERFGLYYDSKKDLYHRMLIIDNIPIKSVIGYWEFEGIDVYEMDCPNGSGRVDSFCGFETSFETQDSHLLLPAWDVPNAKRFALYIAKNYRNGGKYKGIARCLTGVSLELMKLMLLEARLSIEDCICVSRASQSSHLEYNYGALEILNPETLGRDLYVSGTVNIGEVEIREN